MTAELVLDEARCRYSARKTHALMRARCHAAGRAPVPMLVWPQIALQA